MTEETKRDIRIYNHHGWTYSQIAKRTGAKFSEIKNAIEEENTEMAKKLSQEQYDIITAGLKDRKTYEVIAEEAKCSPNTVYRFAKDIRAEEEKEPETAGTETGSKENVCENVSEPIIPETEEIVKTPVENLSEAVSAFGKAAVVTAQTMSGLPEQLAPDIIVEAITDKLSDELKRQGEAICFIREKEREIQNERDMLEIIKHNVKTLQQWLKDNGYGDVLIVFEEEIALQNGTHKAFKKGDE